MIKNTNVVGFFTLLLAGCSGLVLGNLLVKSFQVGLYSDFHVYYYIPKAVLTLARPEHPYTNFTPLFPYFFPPASINLFYPLLLVPFYVSKIVFTLVNLVVLLATGFLLDKIFCKKTSLLFWLFIFLSSIFYPIRFTFLTGQFNLILMFVFVSGLYFTVNQKPVLLGFVASIGAVTKITPIILFFYAILKKDIKATVTFIIVVGALVVLSEFTVRENINYYYVRHVLNDVAAQADSSIDYREQSLMAIFRRVYLFQNEKTNLSILGKNLDYDDVRAIFSYIVTLSLGFYWLYLYFKRGKDKINTVIDLNLLTILAVLGTGLTWFHQYSMIFPALFSLIYIASLLKNKNYSRYMFVAFTALFLLMFLPNYRANYYLQLNLIFSGLVLLGLYFFIKYKSNKIFVTRKFALGDYIISGKYLYLSFTFFVVCMLVTLNPFTINKNLQLERDEVRVRAVDYMANKLNEADINFIQGSSNSYIKNERLDEGYVLIKKSEIGKVQKDLSILFLDPINNQKYNYYFSTVDENSFKMGAALEQGGVYEVLCVVGVGCVN